MADTSERSIGMKAPEFILPASNGVDISLAGYYSRKNVYLFFVREFN